MVMTTKHIVQHATQVKNGKHGVNSKENILERINRIAKTEKAEGISIRPDGTLNLDNLTPRCIHSILLETEKLGLDYTIEKSTVIRIQD